MKAMRKDRCRRYRSASELADDVRNYLNGLPLIAGPETTIYRVQKFVTKHAGSVATVALVAAAIVLGLIVSTVMYLRSEEALKKEAIARVQAEDAKEKETAARVRAERAEKIAQKQRELAEEQRKIAQEQAEANRRALYFARVAEAQAVSKYLPVDQTRRILKSCPEDLRAWEWYYLWHVSDPSLLSIEGHDGYMSDIEWSPCGRYFASAGAEDNTTKVWDTETGTEILTLNDQKEPVSDVSFSPDGRLLAIACYDKLVRVYEIPSGKEVFKLEGHNNQVRCVAFGSSGKQLVSGDFDGVIKVWDALIGANEATIKNPDGYVGSVAFIHGTDQIVASSGKLVKVWDAATQTELTTLHGHTGDVRCVVVTPDGKRIVSGGEDSMIKVWDAISGKELMTLRGHTDIVSTISISSDGTRLVSAGLRDKMVKIWDLLTGQELLTYRGHVSWVNCVAFSPDGQRIVSGGAWGDMKVWDATGDPSHETFEAHQNNLISLLFSPDGNSIVSCSTNGAIKLWDTASGVEMSTWGEFDRVPFGVAYHPNGKKIASGYEDGRIVVWDTANNSKIRTILGHDKLVTCLAFSSDGRRLASGSRDKTVKIWDTTKWNCELVLVGHENSVWSVSFSPDGKYLVSGDSDGTVRVWDTSNGAMVKVLRGHKGRVISVAFTTDGQRIISGSRYDFVRVWDLHEGVELMVLGEKPLYARALAVSPDGKRIAYIDPAASTAVVLDTATGTQALAIPIPGTLLTSLAFSPNGRTIALACDKRIFLFESDVPASAYKLRRDAGKSRDLLDQLHGELGSSSKIADRLRVDTTYDKKVREMALQICLSRQWDELNRQVKESMETSRIAEKDIAEYERAMRQAQRANNSQPDDQFGLTALGVAQYRVGSYEEALKSLTLANNIWMSSHKESHLLSLAFTSMTQYHLGLVEKGRTSMTIMRDNLENVTFENLRSQKYYESYRIEAEKVFAGRNKQLITNWELIDAKELDQAIEVFFQLRPHSEEADSEYSFSLAGLAKCLSRACYARGKSCLVDKDLGYVNRASDYETAVRIDPNYVSALKDLAWLRATCAVEEVRNPEKAVEVASRTCELTDWKDHECLSVLAAACSENERFVDAVRWQQEAIDCLPTEDEDQLKWEGNYHERLRLYKSGMPYSVGERWSFTKGRLVAAWDFNDVEQGIVNDRIVGLEGKLVDGAEVIADEVRGNVLGIHGQGGIECHRDATFDISGAISIGAWFKLQTLTTSWWTIISKGDSWYISANSDSNSVDMRIRIVQNEKYLKGLTYNPSWQHSILANVDLTDKRWHHVTGTYDGERICLYIDGKLSDFTNVGGDIAMNENVLFIGDNSNWPEANWNCRIDDVCIYSFALSPEEVKMLYEGKEPPRTKQ
jgi:WD40 repeat protein